MIADDSVVRDPRNAKAPLVSVLVPSYNHEKYVIECLESIKGLSYPRLELILSDDGSSDATYNLAEQWVRENSSRFERAIVVKQPKNLGVVRNLQFLFDQAHGEYLSYIASDDTYLEFAVTERLAVFIENPNVDGVFGNAQQISASGEVLKSEFIPKLISAQLASPDLIALSLILNWCVPGPVMMLRRAAVLEGGSLGPLPTDLEGEDGYIYIRLAAKKRLRFLSAVVARWRFVPGSMSNTNSPHKLVQRYTLTSNKLNRKLLSGIDKFAIEIRIAEDEAALNRNRVIIRLLKRSLLRTIAILLRLSLRVRTFFGCRYRGISIQKTCRPR